MPGETKMIIITSDEDIIRQFGFNKNKKTHKGLSISLGPSQKKCSFFLIINVKRLKLWLIISSNTANIILNFHIFISTNKDDI
jgi:hypothetical protein